MSRQEMRYDALRRPAFWLTIALVFTVPWEAAIQLGAIGRGSRILGMITALVWALSVVLRRRLRKLDAFVKAYFAFLVWNGLTVLWSIAPAVSFRGFITYTQIFAMILILWDLLETERQVETALQAFVVGAYVSAASVVVNWLTAPTTRFPEHQRINALGFETDGIALVVAIAIPAAWHLATGPSAPQRSNWLTAAFYGYVPTAVFAIILTGTRGAAMASVPTLVFILWTLRRSNPRRRAFAWSVVAIAVLGVMLFAPPHMLDRITGGVGDVIEGDSLSGRRDIWSDGLTNFYVTPVAGVGLDAFRTASVFNKEAHNTPLSILVESGLVGFVLAGYIAFVVLTRLAQLRGWLGWYWKTQIAVVALGSMSLSLEDSKPLWIMAALAVATAAALREEQLAAADRVPIRELTSFSQPPHLGGEESGIPH